MAHVGFGVGFLAMRLMSSRRARGMRGRCELVHASGMNEWCLRVSKNERLDMVHGVMYWSPITIPRSAMKLYALDRTPMEPPYLKRHHIYAVHRSIKLQLVISISRFVAYRAESL